jgi:transcriptional regulator with XRE-family HTH domain
MKYETIILQRKRLLNGWSQKHLAALAGVDTSTVGRVERGENQSPKTVKRLADALGVEMDELVVEDVA